MSAQLVFPFGPDRGSGRDGFLIAPCNEHAFRFIERWPDWPVRAAAIYGPAGSGKSHLARIWKEAAGATELVLACGDGPELAEPPAERALVIEDIDAAEPSEARDHVLMALFERPGTTLLFTGRTAPRNWRVVIGDLRSRFDALLAFAMREPDETLIAALIGTHFKSRQLHVPDPVVRRILTHIERTPAAVAAFVARADRKALAEKRGVSERLVMELIESEEQGR